MSTVLFYYYWIPLHPFLSTSNLVLLSLHLSFLFDNLTQKYIKILLSVEKIIFLFDDQHALIIKLQLGPYATSQ